MSSQLICDICRTNKNVRKLGEVRESGISSGVSAVVLKDRTLLLKVQLAEKRPTQPAPTESLPLPIIDICDRCVGQALRKMANELAPRKRSAKSDAGE